MALGILILLIKTKFYYVFFQIFVSTLCSILGEDIPHCLRELSLWTYFFKKSWRLNMGKIYFEVWSHGTKELLPSVTLVITASWSRWWKILCVRHCTRLQRCNIDWKFLLSGISSQVWQSLVNGLIAIHYSMCPLFGQVHHSGRRSINSEKLT